MRSEEERKRRSFLWGVALAWLPFFPLLIGLLNALRGVSAQKATGLGAVAGGFAEMGVTFFLILAPVLVVSSFVLLLRSFSSTHRLRSFIATVSLCWSALMAAVLALFIWLAVVIRYGH
jgi:hypothetical protein